MTACCHVTACSMSFSASTSTAQAGTRRCTCAKGPACSIRLRRSELFGDSCAGPAMIADVTRRSRVATCASDPSWATVPGPATRPRANQAPADLADASPRGPTIQTPNGAHREVHMGGAEAQRQHLLAHGRRLLHARPEVATADELDEAGVQHGVLAHRLVQHLLQLAELERERLRCRHSAPLGADRRLTRRKGDLHAGAEELQVAVGRLHRPSFPVGAIR